MSYTLIDNNTRQMSTHKISQLWYKPFFSITGIVSPCNENTPKWIINLKVLARCVSVDGENGTF